MDNMASCQAEAHKLNQYSELLLHLLKRRSHPLVPQLALGPSDYVRPRVHSEEIVSQSRLLNLYDLEVPCEKLATGINEDTSQNPVTSLQV